MVQRLEASLEKRYSQELKTFKSTGNKTLKTERKRLLLKERLRLLLRMHLPKKIKRQNKMPLRIQQMRLERRKLNPLPHHQDLIQRLMKGLLLRLRRRSLKRRQRRRQVLGKSLILVLLEIQLVLQKTLIRKKIGSLQQEGSKIGSLVGRPRKMSLVALVV